MLYIRKESNRWAKYACRRSIIGGGFLHLPDELEDEFNSYAPYVSVTSSGGEVTSVADDVTAREAALTLPTQEPSQLDKIEAQTMYTALMTDTLIEEDETDA